MIIILKLKKHLSYKCFLFIYNYIIKLYKIKQPYFNVKSSKIYSVFLHNFVFINKKSNVYLLNFKIISSER